MRSSYEVEKLLVKVSLRGINPTLMPSRYPFPAMYSGDNWMYPKVGPLWEIPPKNALYSIYIVGIMGHESLENIINTMGTLLGVHLIAP